MWTLRLLNFLSYVILVFAIPGWFIYQNNVTMRIISLFIIVFGIWLNRRTRKLLEDY